jgi:hypothetical protein
MNAGRKNGRPRKGDPPRIPYEELDRILVFGEVVPCEDSAYSTVEYPSYRDLARRFGVSHSLIAQYAKRHDCMRRREQAQARIAAQADQKLVELRATAIAMSKDHALHIIDNYLVGFEKALAEGRVRFDSPGDFNTMLRLREFIQGGADSRQEVHGSLSLEDIQARHRQMMQVLAASSPAMRGDVARRGALPARDDVQMQNDNPPASPFDSGTEEVTGWSAGASAEAAEKAAKKWAEAPRAPVRAAGREESEPAPKPAKTAERANTGHTAPTGRLPGPRADEP